jgi:hypothetical protein
LIKKLIEKPIEKITMATPIFTREQIKQYAQTRLFGSNIGPEDVEKIVLVNGAMPSMLEKMVKDKHDQYVVVDQDNAREPILHADGTNYIPQWSGIARERRYKDLLEAYSKINEEEGRKNFEVEINDFNNGWDIPIVYTNYAYDFVTSMFASKEKHKAKRVFLNSDIKEIDTVIFGPTKAVLKSKQTTLLYKGQSEYIDANIVEIDGKKVLNISYVYADQARSIISKLLRGHYTLAKNKGQKKNIDIYMFGRVGALDNNLDRHDTVIPNAMVDERDLNLQFNKIRSVQNILAIDYRQPIVNLNTTSVIKQTIEQLEKARVEGCSIVEMEMKRSYNAIDEALDYEEFINVNFGFVGHVSDKPLHIGNGGKRDTLAEELDSDLGERRALAKIIESIIKRR